MPNQPNPNRKPLPNPVLGVGVQALFGTQTLGLPITEPMIDNTPIGSFWARVGIGISTGQTLVNIALPRQPSGVIIVDNSTGAVVYRTAADRAASGPSTYACRATTFVSVSALFF